MMKIMNLLLVVISVAVLSGCQSKATPPEPINMENVKAEIQKMEDAYAAAEKEKNTEGVLAYYADDAVTYSRNREPLKGKDAMRKSIADRLAKDTSGNVDVYKIVDLYAEGNSAVEIGSWTTVNPAGVEVDKGHYMSYFEKRNGKYVCVRDMNVGSMPEKKAE
jgi:ketosteroid isomerase-like protein